MASILELTDTNASETLANSQVPVLIDFWAERCGSCRMLNPIIEQIAKDYDGKLIVAKLDVDKNPNLAKEQGIKSIPTLLLVKNGTVVEKQIGMTNKILVYKMLDKNLAH